MNMYNSEFNSASSPNTFNSASSPNTFNSASSPNTFNLNKNSTYVIRDSKGCVLTIKKVTKDSTLEVFEEGSTPPTLPSKEIHCNELGLTFKNALDVCKTLGVDQGALSKHLNGKKRFNTVGGFTFRRI